MCDDLPSKEDFISELLYENEYMELIEAEEKWQQFLINYVQDAIDEIDGYEDEDEL